MLMWIKLGSVLFQPYFSLHLPQFLTFCFMFSEIQNSNLAVWASQHENWGPHHCKFQNVEGLYQMASLYWKKIYGTITMDHKQLVFLVMCFCEFSINSLIVISMDFDCLCKWHLVKDCCRWQPQDTYSCNDHFQQFFSRPHSPVSSEFIRLCHSCVQKRKRKEKQFAQLSAQILFSLCSICFILLPKYCRSSHCNQFCKQPASYNQQCETPF